MTVNNINDWNSLIQLAENGDTSAMNDLGIYYRDGHIIKGIEIVKANEELSIRWITESYKMGDLEGMVSYADYISNPNSPISKYNPNKAIEIYKEAISKGAKYANHNLGIEYRNKKDFETAFQCYIKAGRTDEFYKDLSVGLCYYYGIGTSVDKKKSFEIFSSLKKEGCSGYEFNEINYLLSKIYIEGEIVEKDIDKAREYLELANEDEDHRSALELLLIIGRNQAKK